MEYYDSVNNMHVGEYLPEMDIFTVEGNPINISAFKGKVTYLNFWFESCRGCRDEIKEVNILYDSLKNDPGFRFLAITFDSLSTLPEYIKQSNIHYPVASTSSVEKFHSLSFNMGSPAFIIIDKNGRINYIGLRSVSNKDDNMGNISIKKILTLMRDLQK
jgi:peroxiredoxin